MFLLFLSVYYTLFGIKSHRKNNKNNSVCATMYFCVVHKEKKEKKQLKCCKQVIEEAYRLVSKDNLSIWSLRLTPRQTFARNRIVCYGIKVRLTLAAMQTALGRNSPFAGPLEAPKSSSALVAAAEAAPYTPSALYTLSLLTRGHKYVQLH